MTKLTNSTQLFAHVTNAPGVGGLRAAGKASSSFTSNSLCFRTSQSEATLGCDQHINVFKIVEAAANKLSTEAIHITSVTHPFDSRACQVTWERDALSSRQGGPKCRLWRPLMNLVGDFTVSWNSGKTRQQLNNWIQGTKKASTSLGRIARRFVQVPFASLAKKRRHNIASYYH